MIRTLFKLVVAALVLNALLRVGMGYWDHYQFEDSVQQLAQFAERASPEDIKQQVLDLAAARSLPLDEDQLSVTRERRRIEVDGRYTRDLPLFPGYIKPWDFSVHVVVLTLN